MPQLNYRLPNFDSINLPSYANNVAYKAEKDKWIEDTIKENRSIYDQKLTAWTVASEKIAEIWSPSSSQYKYLRRQEVPKAPNIAKLKEKFLKKVEAWREKEREKIERQNYILRRKQAISDLVLAGFIQGEDFYTGNAISMRRQLMVEDGNGIWVRRPEVELENA